MNAEQRKLHRYAKQYVGLLISSFDGKEQARIRDLIAVGILQETPSLQFTDTYRQLVTILKG